MCNQSRQDCTYGGTASLRVSLLEMPLAVPSENSAYKGPAPRRPPMHGDGCREGKPLTKQRYLVSCQPHCSSAPAEYDARDYFYEGWIHKV